MHEANVKTLAMTTDNLLNQLHSPDLFAQAYADVIVVSVAVKFTEVLSDRM